MQRTTVHQWRDWRLEYLGDDTYELLQKADMSVFHTVIAKNFMDAENECQRIIKDLRKPTE